MEDGNTYFREIVMAGRASMESMAGQGSYQTDALSDPAS
jgi:hypothetical protein